MPLLLSQTATSYKNAPTSFPGLMLSKATKPEFCSFMFVVARASFFVCFACVSGARVIFSLFSVVSSSAFDCLERPVSKMIYCVLTPIILQTRSTDQRSGTCSDEGKIGDWDWAESSRGLSRTRRGRSASVSGWRPSRSEAHHTSRPQTRCILHHSRPHSHLTHITTHLLPLSSSSSSYRHQNLFFKRKTVWQMQSALICCLLNF